MEFFSAAEHPVRAAFIAGFLVAGLLAGLGFVLSLWLRLWLSERREELRILLEESARSRDAIDPVRQLDPTLRVYSQNGKPVTTGERPRGALLYEDLSEPAEDPSDIGIRATIVSIQVPRGPFDWEQGGL